MIPELLSIFRFVVFIAIVVSIPLGYVIAIRRLRTHKAVSIILGYPVVLTLAVLGTAVVSFMLVSFVLDALIGSPGFAGIMLFDAGYLLLYMVIVGSLFLLRKKLNAWFIIYPLLSILTASLLMIVLKFLQFPTEMLYLSRIDWYEGVSFAVSFGIVGFFLGLFFHSSYFERFEQWIDRSF